MVKTKEKIKAVKKLLSGDGVKKHKERKAKKKELLDMLRSSMADADQFNEPKKKSHKKTKKISQTSQNEDKEIPVGDDELEKLLYKPMPRKDRKVKLDPRFQEIYTNPEYSGVTRDTDERGALKLMKKSESKQASKPKKKSKSTEESEESQESEVELDR